MPLHDLQAILLGFLLVVFVRIAVAAAKALTMNANHSVRLAGNGSRRSAHHNTRNESVSQRICVCVEANLRTSDM